MRHQRLWKKLLITTKMLKNIFSLHQKLIKKSEPNTEESISKRVKLKNEKIAEIKKEEKNIENELFKYYFINYQKPSDMYKKLRETKDKINEDQVDLIKEILDKIKEEIKNVPKNKKIVIKLNEEINITERILYFNQLEQQDLGLKILTPDQMLSRLPITLAQLKAGNNSEKLKNEIRQILYSLYRSKKHTKQLYKSLVDII